MLHVWTQPLVSLQDDTPTVPPPGIAISHETNATSCDPSGLQVMGPSSVLKDLLDVARKATSDLGCFVAFLVRGSEGPGVPRKLATYTVHQQQSGVLR